MLFLVPVGNGFVCVGDAGTLVFLMNDAHCSPLLSLCVCNITHNDECATKKPGFFGNPGESTRITALSRYVFTGIQEKSPRSFPTENHRRKLTEKRGNKVFSGFSRRIIQETEKLRNYRCLRELREIRSPSTDKPLTGKLLKIGRSRGIRTLDLLVPNQSRYQAALCSAAVFAGNVEYYIS